MKVFLPSVTANVGFWSTLSLNIPDFTRYAKSQKAQLTGQAIGLPVFMALFSFLGVAVTSSTTVIFGEVISDPVQVVSRIQGLAPTVLSLIGLLLATISTMTLVAVVITPFFVFGLAVASLMSDLSASPAGFQAAPKWSYRLACSFRPVALGSTSHRPGP